MSWSSTLPKYALGLVAVLSLSVPSLSSHAGLIGPNLKVNRIAAPRHVVSGVQTVSVGGFEGFEGGALEGRLKSSLVDASRGERAGKGIALDEGFTTTPWQLVEGDADLVIAGTILVSSATEDSKKQVAKKDAQGNVMKTSDGKVIKVEVDCRSRTTSVEVQWTASKADGVIAVSDTATNKKTDEVCGLVPITFTATDLATMDTNARMAAEAAHKEQEAERLGLASQDEQARGILANGSTLIAMALLPRWEVVSIDLDKDKTIKDAVQRVDSGDLIGGACALRNITANDPYNVKAIYGIGAAMEAAGNYGDALDYYGKASGIDGDRGAAKGAERVRARIAEIALLADLQGVTPPENAMRWDACPAAPVGAPKTVRKATTLLDGPGGMPGVGLPKGISVVVVETTGEFVKIVTPDGREGFVLASSVK